MQRIETQLAQGGITTMKAVRGSNKRQLDELGLSVGVRAVLVDKSPTWTPPSWDDPSFFMEGAALPRIVVASHIQASSAHPMWGAGCSCRDMDSGREPLCCG